jgi:hypothetical protein
VLCNQFKEGRTSLLDERRLRRWVGKLSNTPPHILFHLFGKLNEHLQGKRFPLIKKWKMKQETGLPTWTQIFMQKVF